MADYQIIEVLSKKDLMRFIKFPDELYKDCPQYVPALHSDQVKSLTKCSTAQYCPHKMWIVVDGKKVVGRICAMVNPRYNEHYGRKRARFGWFDTINDIVVAKLLIDTAEAWAKSMGMDEIHGPLYFNTLGKQCMLCDGYENIPPFNCYYNFPYYNDLISQLGYEKELDWIQYLLNARQDIPDKMVAIANRLQERFKLTRGDVDRLKKDKNLVRKFFKMYNDSFSGNVKNFIPFTDEEIEEEAAQSISMLNKKLCCFLLDEQGELAAFGVACPSISRGLLRGVGWLFRFGWIHMLRALRNCENVDLMLNGAAPKWNGTGVSSVFHIALSQSFRAAGAQWAVTNPQIEDNSAAFVWEKYENKLYMRRRCYIKFLG